MNPTIGKYVFLLFFLSKSIYADSEVLTQNETKLLTGLTESEEVLLENRKLDWGLSLSGGGLRSALFQIGVLKSLYDKGKLAEIDFISAVSGGGYAAYWLYGNQYLSSKDNEASPANSFGYYSLDDSVFASSTCDLYTTSNFVGYPRLLYKWATGTHPDDYYQDSIARTFGNKDVIDGKDGGEDYLYLSDLIVEINNNNVPYLIMNGTVNYSRKDDWLAHLYEMTPLHRGNDLMGYSNWDNNRSIRFTKSALISGAAVEFLLKQNEVPISDSMYKNPLVLHDGGKSEKLRCNSLN